MKHLLVDGRLVDAGQTYPPFNPATGEAPDASIEHAEARDGCTPNWWCPQRCRVAHRHIISVRGSERRHGPGDVVQLGFGARTSALP
jgi:hypothetical protein